MAIETQTSLSRALDQSDGNYHWFLTRYNPLNGEQGQSARRHVAATDMEGPRGPEMDC